MRKGKDTFETSAVLGEEFGVTLPPADSILGKHFRIKRIGVFGKKSLKKNLNNDPVAFEIVKGVQGSTVMKIHSALLMMKKSRGISTESLLGSYERSLELHLKSGETNGNHVFDVILFSYTREKAYGINEKVTLDHLIRALGDRLPNGTKIVPLTCFEAVSLGTQHLSPLHGKKLHLIGTNFLEGDIPTLLFPSRIEKMFTAKTELSSVENCDDTHFKVWLNKNSCVYAARVITWS